VSFSTKTRDGCIEYKLIRPIEAGEPVSMSYIAECDLVAATEHRRKVLNNSKAFFCQCERCIGPDYCCLLSCSNKNCTGVWSKQQVNQDDPPAWSCNKCGSKEPSAVSGCEDTFESFNRRLLLIDARCRTRGVGGIDPHVLQILTRDIQKALSPRHYLALKALEQQTLVCASHAVSIEQMEDVGLFSRGYVTRLEQRFPFVAWPPQLPLSM
jgi:hypothetical protein